jgi:hypothetical protein
MDWWENEQVLQDSISSPASFLPQPYPALRPKTHPKTFVAQNLGTKFTAYY